MELIGLFFKEEIYLVGQGMALLLVMFFGSVIITLAWFFFGGEK